MAGAPSLVSSLAERLRPLSGLEQELVIAARDGNAAALCNELLARCLVESGAALAESRREIGELLVPDRDLALVCLRWRSFGRTMPVTIGCAACGEHHDVDVDLDRLAPPPAAPREVVIGGHARVRLPTARDQADVWTATRGDVLAGRDTLLARTLVELGGRTGPFSTADVASIAPDLRDAIDEAIETALPDIDLALTAACPACSEAIEAPVHLGELVLSELREHSRELLHDVHVLARTYHWSEQEILQLSLPRRRAYLALIEAENDAALFADAGDVHG